MSLSPPVIASLITYVAAATVLTLTPGLDTALVIRTATTYGARSAALAGVGIAIGCFAWAGLVAAGLGAVLAASQVSYAIMRWVGAAYLLWVGFGMLRRPRSAFIEPTPRVYRPGAPFLTGALTNLLNPKVGIFYVTFLPQFVPHGVAAGPYMLLLGAIHGVLGLIWFGCLIAATRPIAVFLRRPAVVKNCDRMTGAIFMAFGLGLALEARR
jgi:threonine/homoserine/homoserine lactone efflux protein